MPNESKRIPERSLKRAFTLIELLVVIAIIAILASILFPVFAQAREDARKTTCLSNEKQISLAFIMYTQDYDEEYPNTDDPMLFAGEHWRWPIMSYLDIGQKRKPGSFSAESGVPSVLVCPSDTVSGTSFDNTSYDYSAAFYHSPQQISGMHFGDLFDTVAQLPTYSQSDADVMYPSQKILIGEWLNNHNYGASGRIGYWGSNFQFPSTPGTDRWEGGRVYAFADGHAKFIMASNIIPSLDNCPDINLTPDGVAGKDVH